MRLCASSLLFPSWLVTVAQTQGRHPPRWRRPGKRQSLLPRRSPMCFGANREHQLTRQCLGWSIFSQKMPLSLLPDGSASPSAVPLHASRQQLSPFPSQRRKRKRSERDGRSLQARDGGLPRRPGIRRRETDRGDDRRPTRLQGQGLRPSTSSRATGRRARLRKEAANASGLCPSARGPPSRGSSCGGLGGPRFGGGRWGEGGSARTALLPLKPSSVCKRSRSCPPLCPEGHWRGRPQVPRPSGTDLAEAAR
mmetsp:Transcript_12226/g.23690  ORF Transcript_12226/g.23690 Transcript_12226/m.23690 type:complete len:252 (-) Transcript_12226:823-1578(-)